MRTVLGSLLEDRARRNGGKAFLRYREQVVTYAEAADRARRVARGLADLGVDHGTHVGIFLPNRSEFVDTWFALATLGAVEVPVNVAHRGDLLRHVVKQSDVELLVTDAPLLERLAEVPEALGRVRAIVLVGDGPAPDDVVGRKVVPFDDLLGAAPLAGESKVAHSDPLAIIYTSGTTGRSKGAICCHAYYLALAADYVAQHRIVEDDCLYCYLPLFHVNAQAFTICGALVANATVALTERFSASRFWGEVRAYGCTVFNAHGATLAMLFRQPERPDDADNRVRVVHATPAPPWLYESFERRFGVKLQEDYGSTESGVICYMPYDEVRIGSCGLPLPEYEVRIVDENDDEVPSNTVGEIVSRPRAPWRMFSGYYRMPEETLHAFRNLFFHTGDLGRKDDDGYVYFAGRKADYLRRRGENVSCYEVENVLMNHPAVHECAVVGAPAEIGEEEVWAIVLRKPDAQVTELELVQFCESRLPYFAVPRFVSWAQSLPKTPTGKTEKFRLRADGPAAAWDRQRVGYKVRR